MSLFDANEDPCFCEVAIDTRALPGGAQLTYLLPPHLRDIVRIGSQVRVPLGKRTVLGVVVGFTDAPPPVAIKPVVGPVAQDLALDQQQVALAKWLAEHYRATLWEALRCFMPPASAARRERLLTLTEAGHQAVGLKSGAQGQVLEVLRARECVTTKQLAAQLGGRSEDAARATRAVRALVAQGLVKEVWREKRGPAGARRQQIVRLAQGRSDWTEVIADLSRRAPRQAQILTELFKSHSRALPLCRLARSSVMGLCRAGLVEVVHEQRASVGGEPGFAGTTGKPLRLTESQRRAVEEISQALGRGKFASFLIHGVTGSGKTEVYLHSIEAALALGRRAIVLVPEIALTPQAVARFQSRFGDRLAVLHSGLGLGTRSEEWGRVQRGEADIVVGARSAVFAPCRNLGIVVVDEEHEPAYWQETEPRYRAPTVAEELARRAGAVLVLGSATPTVETYHRWTTEPERLRLLELPERTDGQPLPPVELVDLRKEPVSRERGGLSDVLLEALRECVAAGNQAMLFLNRRGFSTFVMCRECGHSLRCPDCAVALTYHHKTRRLRCHHCDFDRSVPDRCENCEGFDIGFHGLGTERAADLVHRLVQGAVVARMDRDTTGRRGAHAAILRSFAKREANVLVGTQMIAKGHDFPNVTLVGVLNADTALNRPDFRAAERTFQLLTQVAGRAGRGPKGGRVIVQTYNPDHYAIQAASLHDYNAFYSREIEARRKQAYPPFVHLVKIGFADQEEAMALTAARRVACALEEIGVRNKRGDPHYIGPAEAPLHRLRGKYRYHMLIKGSQADLARDVVETALRKVGQIGTTQLTVDVDPTDMM